MSLLEELGRTREETLDRFTLEDRRLRLSYGPGKWTIRAILHHLSRDLYDATREGIIHYARIHYERDGDREFVHSETGVRTLRDEFDKVARHNRHHLEQILTALEGDGE